MTTALTEQQAAAGASATRAANEAAELAASIVVDSPEMYELAASEVQAIAGRRRRIEELRLSITRPMDEAKRRVMEMFKAPLDKLEQAESAIRRGMLGFKQAEDARIAREKAEAERIAREEREAAEAARRAAEAEAAAARRAVEEAERKAQEQVEASRRAAEEALLSGNAAEAEEAARKAEEAARAAAAEREEAAARAESAAAAAQEADMAASMAEVAPPPVAITTATKASGISSRQNWKAEVLSLRELVIAAGKAAEAGDETLLGYLEANTKALGGTARALKGAARVPGVRFYADTALAVRAAAA